MAVSGVKAFSIFGDIQLKGLAGSVTKMKAFEAAGLRGAHSMGKLSSAAAVTATRIAAVGVGVGLLIGAGSVAAFANFDSAMTSSLAIMGDVSDTMQGELSNAARQVGRTTKFSATQAAEAYFFLASAGLSAKQSIAAMPRVAAFAQAGNFDLALATDLLTDAQSALGLTIRNDTIKNMENMARVSNVLVKANTLANASVLQFSESLTNRAGAALRIVNKDIEEGVAVLAAMADQGVKGAEAGTRLDIVMRDLQTRAIKNEEAFKRYNIVVFDGNGKMRNMADIIRDLEGAMEGMTNKQKRALLMTLDFSDRSVASLLTVIGLSDAIRQYERDLRSAGDITDEVANKQMVSLRAQTGLLRDEFVDIGLSIGSTTDGPLTRFVTIVRESIVAIREFNALPTKVDDPGFIAARDRVVGGQGPTGGGPILPGITPFLLNPQLLTDIAAEVEQTHREIIASANEMSTDFLRHQVQWGNETKQQLISRLADELLLVEEFSEDWIAIANERNQLLKELQDKADDEALEAHQKKQEKWAADAVIFHSIIMNQASRGTVTRNVRRTAGAAASDDGAFVGRAFVTGVMQGMRGQENALKNVVEAILTRVMQRAVFSLLGIGSPSKEAMKIGRFWMEGLALGLQSSEAMLRRSALGSVGAMVGGTMAAGGAAGGGMRLGLDLSALPEPTDPRQAARDGDWQFFLRESFVVARGGGEKI